MRVADAVKVEASWATTAFQTPTWVDVTAAVESANWRRSSRAGGNGSRAEPGDATILLRNEDGEYEPSNPASSIGANLARWKQIRISTSDDAGSTWIPSWQGFLWDLRPSADGQRSTVVMVCVDAFTALSRFGVASYAAPHQLAGDRIAGILTQAGWPALHTGTNSSGTVYCPAATLEGNALGLIQEAAAAEAGYLWVDAGGKIRFEHRFYHVEVTPWQTSQVTLDDAWILNDPVMSTIGGFEHVSRASVVASSGRTFVYDAAPSFYPPDTEILTGSAVAFDADAAQLVKHWQRAHDHTGQWPDTVTFQAYPGNQTGLTAIGDSSAGTRQLDVWHRARWLAKPKGWAADQDIAVIVEGLEFAASASGGLRCTARLAPYVSEWHDDAVSLFYQFGDTLASPDILGI